MTDPYQLLGIRKGASVPEIRRAHRTLAFRWHPDRFQEGPERMWAESRMIEINMAFEEVMRQAVRAEPMNDMAGDGERLEDVRRLLEANQLSAARQALMRVATRSAEWNYLFGSVLRRLGEEEKALLYFGIAARQRPENQQYQAAYKKAKAQRRRIRLDWLFKRR